MTHSKRTDYFPTSSPERTHPHTGGPLGATTACPNSTHISQAVPDATAWDSGWGALLVCSPPSLYLSSPVPLPSGSKRPKGFLLTKCPTCLERSCWLLHDMRLEEKSPLKCIIPPAATASYNLPEVLQAGLRALALRPPFVASPRNT